MLLAVTIRFTPTGVGTICVRWMRRARPTVHPHGRGDNFREALPDFVAGGSPPRAWGQCDEALPVVLDRRFTPTGVGTIATDTYDRQRRTVHPHGRGDNLSLSYICANARGSPPRAWGQWYPHRPRAASIRFTPTGVGTITRRSKMYQSIAVHPHGRGDNGVGRSWSGSLSGSPPRAWGQ